MTPARAARSTPMSAVLSPIGLAMDSCNRTWRQRSACRPHERSSRRIPRPRRTGEALRRRRCQSGGCTLHPSHTPGCCRWFPRGRRKIRQDGADSDEARGDGPGQPLLHRPIRERIALPASRPAPPERTPAAAGSPVGPAARHTHRRFPAHCPIRREGQEREALDMIPVRVTEEQVRPTFTGSKRPANQICPRARSPEPPSIMSCQIAYLHRDTGRVAAHHRRQRPHGLGIVLTPHLGEQGIGAQRRRQRPPYAPETNLHGTTFVKRTESTAAARVRLSALGPTCT